MTDLAVVGMDPTFGGGGAAQTQAFLDAAAALGRATELHYTPMPSRFRPVDSVNQVVNARRTRDGLRGAADVWVVTTAAAYGLGAALAGRPYSCWIGTGLREEWAGRRPGLRASRRLAIRINAPVLRRIERRVLRDAARVYATSPFSRASVAHAGDLPVERVGILPLPVDVDAITPATDEEWRRTLDNPVVAFLGRADDPRKNVRLLLDALPLLPDVRVLLIGSPPTGRLPSRAEATGPVASVAPHLRRATLFVLPSHQEGFGIAAAEALAAGLPVVTTPCGGPEDLVTRSGAGRVLTSFAPEDLAATVSMLLADHDGLAAMRPRGRAHVVREHSPSRLRELLAPELAE